MSNELSSADILRVYEEGKHRRYNLLFAVNGGAFAIANLFVDLHKPMAVLEGEPSAVLGELTLGQISLGMALFTIVMIVDIFFFGQSMRRRMRELFGLQGKLVLTSIGWLIAAGWTVVSFGVLGLAFVTPVYLGAIATVWVLTERKSRQTLGPLPEELKQLNQYTFQAESRRRVGEKQEDWETFLRRVLAADFRISSASRKVQDKEEMIERIRGDVREREGLTDVGGGVEDDYGVVTSIITVKGDPSKYHNCKVFERQPSGDWHCVYWRATRLTRQ